MDKYINVDLLIKNLNLLINRSFLGEIRCTSEISIGELSSLIADQPIIKFRPVVNGEWKYWSSSRDSGWECSNCKMDSSYKGSYCPNCGAEMESDINEIN